VGLSKKNIRSGGIMPTNILIKEREKGLTRGIGGDTKKREGETGIYPHDDRSPEGFTDSKRGRKGRPPGRLP